MIQFLLPLLSTVVGKVFDVAGSKLGVDMNSDELKKARLEAELEIQKAAAQLELKIQEANMKQIEVNVAEAQNANLFVAGWRPFIGWVCGFALAYHFILQPLILFIVASAGQTINLPTFDMQSLMTVMMGMLGLGAMRSYEKVYGTARDTLKADGSYFNEQNVVNKKGRLVDDPEAGGLVWRLD